MNWSFLALLLSTLLLAGCKLGGQASGVVGELMLTETYSGKTLAVKTDGPFIFNEDFAPGTRYNVVAEAKQPPPDYSCDVNNGQGTIRGNVSNIKVECGNRFCTTQYEPVCAKELTDIVCITTPCPNYQYRTFSNACEASNAQISFAGECGSLENMLSTDAKPIVITEFNPEVNPETLANIIDTKFDGDNLLLTVGFSGCDDKHSVKVSAKPTFLESFPVQVATLVQHFPVQACDAYFTKTVSIDLLPLKHRYIDQYQQTSGAIALQGIGTYQF